MLEIASMLEEKNISDVHKWAPLHGTRVHKARRDKNKSPANQVVDGEAIDNMVILGESGVGKSESIEYMLKIREKILLLYEVIKKLPESKMKESKKAEILAILQPLVDLELLATGDDMAAIRVDEEGNVVCNTNEKATFTRTNFVEAVGSAPETVIYRVDETGNIVTSKNARVIRHNPDDLRQTHHIVHKPNMMVLITNTDQA